jgi:hypothetical protein
VVIVDGLIGFPLPFPFAPDEAATKSLYLARRNIQAKCPRGDHACEGALPYLTMLCASPCADSS